MSELSYKSSGVDLDVYRESMSRLPRLMQRTFSPRVINWQGGFAGLFQLDFGKGIFARNYQEPILVAGSDGVGTKLMVAQLLKRHDSLGIDLVAMCVNDVICCGAEPLFFLDYVAMGRDDPARLESIVKGISDGCVEADCALLGGETAIMPGLYDDHENELAGFCVGVVEKKHLIKGDQVAPGDVCVAIASSGFHANGYSLIRKIVFDHAKLKVDDALDFTHHRVGECLMRPTRIYTKVVRAILGKYKVKNVVHAMVHITGGGLPENIDRVLPPGTAAEIDTSSWQIPPEFTWLEKLGNVKREEMFRVFNMGVGFVMIVSPYFADSIQRSAAQLGFDTWQIGKIVPGEQNVILR